MKANATTPQAKPAVAEKPVAAAPARPAETPEMTDDVKPTESAKIDVKPAADKPSPKVAEKPTTAAGWRKRAEEEAEEEHIEEAIAAVEQALALEPDDRPTQWKMVELTVTRGAMLVRTDRDKANDAFVKAAAALKKYQMGGMPLTEDEQQVAAYVLYNEACVEAGRGNKDRAVAALGESLDAGWSNLDHLQTDTDLDSLRELPAYKKLLEQHAAKAAAKAREEAEELLAAGKTFPFEFSLPDLDEKTVTLKELAGKVVIVDFWGTWCPPCRMEIPHFVALHKKYNERGLEIVGINYEHTKKAEAVETIRKFATQAKIPYSCLIGDEETKDRVPNLRGFPTTLFIDRAGKVRAQTVGYRPMVGLEAIVSILLDEKAEKQEKSEK